MTDFQAIRAVRQESEPEYDVIAIKLLVCAAIEDAVRVYKKMEKDIDWRSARDFLFRKKKLEKWINYWQLKLDPGCVRRAAKLGGRNGRMQTY